MVDSPAGGIAGRRPDSDRRSCHVRHPNPAAAPVSGRAACALDGRHRRRPGKPPWTGAT